MKEKQKVIEKTVDVNIQTDDEDSDQSNCKYSLSPRQMQRNNGFNIDESCYMEYEESENSLNVAFTEFLPEMYKSVKNEQESAAMTL